MHVIILLSVLTTAMCVDDRVITTLKYSRYRVKPTIVNGDPVQNSKVPYIVSIKTRIRQMDGDSWLWHNLCGGSIIGSTKVLTAAHCFEDNNFYYAHNYEPLRIVAGEVKSEVIHTGKTETSAKGQWRKVQKIVVNSHFLFPNNDIAMVYVTEAWYFTPFVRPINTATRTIDYPDTCYSAGYGKLSDDAVAQEAPSLLRARIKVLPRWQCAVLWEMNMNNFICTDSTFGDVAKGDSGGPLACRGILETRTSDDEVLVGLVSGKNFDKTTLYTRISAFHDWIQTDSANKITVPIFVIIPILLIYLLFLLKENDPWSVKEINAK